MKPLTERQSKVLMFLRERAQDSMPPRSVRFARRQGLAQHQRFTPVLGVGRRRVYHTPKRIKPRNPYAW